MCYDRNATVIHLSKPLKKGGNETIFKTNIFNRNKKYMFISEMSF